MGRISSRELSEWQEYAKLEPFGEERADLRNAQTCQVLANLWAKKSDGSPFEISDFLFKFIPDDAVESAYDEDELEQIDWDNVQTLVGDYGTTEDGDEIRAREKALQMARLVIEMNKALGGEDNRTDEQKARLGKMAAAT